MKKLREIVSEEPIALTLGAALATAAASDALIHGYKKLHTKIKAKFSKDTAGGQKPPPKRPPHMSVWKKYNLHKSKNPIKQAVKK